MNEIIKRIKSFQAIVDGYFNGDTVVPWPTVYDALVSLSGYIDRHLDDVGKDTERFDWLEAESQRTDNQLLIVTDPPSTIRDAVDKMMSRTHEAQGSKYA